MSKESIRTYKQKYFQLNKDKIRERRKKQLASLPKSVKDERSRRYYLKYLYGISKDDYDNRLQACNFRCPICSRKHDSSKARSRLVVDHNHKDGKVRGLLCHQCNVAIGLCSENPIVLKALAKYLEDSQNASSDNTESNKSQAD